MGLYAVKRLGAVLVILVIMSILVFLATHALPTNTAAMILGQYSTPETQKALEHKLGLDLPLAVQYWNWASLVLQGDLGQSLVMERPIAPMLWDAFGKLGDPGGQRHGGGRHRRAHAGRDRRGA